MTGISDKEKIVKNSMLYVLPTFTTDVKERLRKLPDETLVFAIDGSTAGRGPEYVAREHSHFPGHNARAKRFGVAMFFNMFHLPDL